MSRWDADATNAGTPPTDTGSGISPSVGAAGITAGVGLIGGLMAQRAQKKAAARQRQFEFETNKTQQLANIELQRGKSQQVALNNIVTSLRSAFLG